MCHRKRTDREARERVNADPLVQKARELQAVYAAMREDGAIDHLRAMCAVAGVTMTPAQEVDARAAYREMARDAGERLSDAFLHGQAFHTREHPPA